MKLCLTSPSKVLSFWINFVFKYTKLSKKSFGMSNNITLITILDMTYIMTLYAK